MRVVSRSPSATFPPKPPQNTAAVFPAHSLEALEEVGQGLGGSVRGRREDVRDLGHLPRLETEHAERVRRDVGGFGEIGSRRAGEVEDVRDRRGDLGRIEAHATEADHGVRHLLGRERCLASEPLGGLRERLELVARRGGHRLDKAHLVVKAREGALRKRERQGQRTAEDHHVLAEALAGAAEIAELRLGGSG